MTNKFVREKHLVELLLKRLGFAASGYLDPNDASGVETGVDVIAIIAQKRIGIQVTELDTGSKAGQARADEKKLAAGAGANGGVYGAWAQNNSLEFPLQFIASTCIAQNACVPRLRTSVLTLKRRRWRLFSAFSRSSRRFSRRNSA
jgi:hypothetical protein